MAREDDYVAKVEADILKKLGEAQKRNIGAVNEISSMSYQQFKDDEKKLFVNFYEKYCDFAHKLIPFIKLSQDAKKEYQDKIELAILNVVPDALFSASILTFLLSLLLALPCMIMGWNNLALFFIFSGLFISYTIVTYPKYAASIITIRAQQESLLAILYMSLFLRVNPVVESSIYFATEHLNGPLGKDLKQVLWLVETEKVGSVEDAINFFIPLWVKRNKDFVRSFLILHSISAHSDLEERERILNKSLETILSNTYTSMKIYSYNLKTPVMILNSFGMMLPLIGLIAFPMISIFLAESVNISYLFFGYLVILPALTLFFMNRIISKRPGAFSFPDISTNKNLPPEGKLILNIKDRTIYLPALKIALIIGFLVMIPGFYHIFTNTIPYYINGVAELSNTIPKSEYTFTAMALSLTIPFGFALIFIIYYYAKSKYKIELRNRILEIEEDLGDTVFAFGNQFSEQIPIESALKNYIQESEMLNMKRRSIFQFFVETRDRIENEGVTFEKAIFDTKNSLLEKYPSVLLKEVMWIVVEGSKKGAKVLYKIIANISTYLENVNKIKDLIFDLLVETSTSIKVQARYLAPFLAGVVGSLTLIIVKSLAIMSEKLSDIMKLFSAGGAQSQENFFGTLFNFAQITPPTVFEVLVGIYLVETVILLSILSNGVDNGFDRVSRDEAISKNLMIAITVFSVVSIVGMFALNQFLEKGLLASGA